MAALIDRLRGIEEMAGEIGSPVRVEEKPNTGGFTGLGVREHDPNTYGPGVALGVHMDDLKPAVVIDGTDHTDGKFEDLRFGHHAPPSSSVVVSASCRSQ